MTEHRTISNADIPEGNIVLRFMYTDPTNPEETDTVTIEISGFTYGINALRAVSEVGNQENINYLITQMIDNGYIKDADKDYMDKITAFIEAKADDE